MSTETRLTSLFVQLLVALLVVCCCRSSWGQVTQEIQILEERITELHSVLLPPNGAARDDVEALYGRGHETGYRNPPNLPVEAWDGILRKYTAYELLQKTVTLFVEYRDNTVVWAGISHSCDNSRMRFSLSYHGRLSETESAREPETRRAEMRQMAEELTRIYQESKSKIQAAPWNSKAPNKTDAGDGK